MATTAASYRNSQAALTPESKIELCGPQSQTCALPEDEFAELYQLQEDLGALCAAGLIGTQADEHGVIRFTPTEKAIA